MRDEIKEKLDAMWDSETPELKSTLIELIKGDEQKLSQVIYGIMEAEQAKAGKHLDEDEIMALTKETIAYFRSKVL